MQTAALFDLDGVLVDTEGQYTRFWKAVGEEDFPEIPDFATRIKGHTLVQIYNQYYHEQSEKQASITSRLNRFELEMDFPLIPGALAFVEALRAAGYRTAVVTSSNQAKFACLLRHHPDFASYFDRIFTAEDALRSKPAPDCYIAAARSLGFEASECYVFEDSINGLRAGYDSGAIVVGLTTTNTENTIKPYCCHTMADFTNIKVEQLVNLKR